MIEGVDAPPCTEDRGEPQPAPKPCVKTTWCYLEPGHDGPCLEIARQPIPPNDFGPRRKRKP